jgi:glycosyltransferase involved in cell wall biosynthesis
MAPLVSVVLPCYNAVLAGYFREAVESVLAQSLNNFELIIIDDGSTDETWEAIKKLTDSRVRAYRQENAGLASTLNRAISYAKSTYIARQDQDDVMLPGRLEKQFAFMAQHPEVAGVGTWAEIMVGGDPSELLLAFPTSHEALSLWLLFDNPFVHSSMLLRKDALLSVGGYCEDRSRQPPEDYELWSRLARNYRLANLGDVLTAYREVPGSMSRAGENPFVQNLIRISAENLQHRFGESFPLGACSGLARLYHGVLGGSKDRLGFFRFWVMVRELMLANEASGDASLHYECRKVRRQIAKRLAYRFLLEQLPPIRGILGRFLARC